MPKRLPQKPRIPRVSQFAIVYRGRSRQTLPRTFRAEVIRDRSETAVNRAESVGTDPGRCRMVEPFDHSSFNIRCTNKRQCHVAVSPGLEHLHASIWQWFGCKVFTHDPLLTLVRLDCIEWSTLSDFWHFWSKAFEWQPLDV